jgi:hypothetical protein
MARIRGDLDLIWSVAAVAYAADCSAHEAGGPRGRCAGAVGGLSVVLIGIVPGP